jgi:hypothetical protein
LKISFWIMCASCRIPSRRRRGSAAVVARVETGQDTLKPHVVEQDAEPGVRRLGGEALPVVLGVERLTDLTAAVLLAGVAEVDIADEGTGVAADNGDVGALPGLGAGGSCRAS